MIKIHYEDNHILVCDKPFNQLSQADDTEDLDILTELKAMIKVRDQKPGNVYLGLVQRLDRPVGGIMVFAKTSKAASRLSDQIRRRVIEKTYIAVVEGIVEPGHFVDYLKKDSKTNTSVVTHKNDPDGKFSELMVLSATYHPKYDLSTLTIALITGRPHQIRVQCASRHHALWGDQRYNTKAEKNQQIALWASTLTFEHPTTKEKLTFTSEPPKQFPFSI